jgi:hypothetical protein
MVMANVVEEVELTPTKNQPPQIARSLEKLIKVGGNLDLLRSLHVETGSHSLDSADKRRTYNIY